MRFRSGKNKFDINDRTVVITGGSQGMGRGLAKLLAQKGAHVVIVARDQNKLEAAVEYISAAARNPQTQRFYAISADVTTPEENDRIIEEVTAWNNGVPPDVVWANAGMAHPDPFIDTPVDVLRSQMDINYWAAVYLAQTTLKAWLAAPQTSARTNLADVPKPRHFVMTSSVACFAGIAGYAPYSPAKSAMRSLADTLHSELNLYNGALCKSATGTSSPVIKIHCVCPGAITSPGYKNEQKIKHEITKILEESDIAQTEDEVAAAAVRGLEKGRYLITTQLVGHAMRAGALGSSPRDAKLRDTLFSWITSVAWLFIGPSMDKKVFKYGKMNGVRKS
ncbi:NAD(P)-binding protein, partial [Aureobasidium melanogenum]